VEARPAARFEAELERVEAQRPSDMKASSLFAQRRSEGGTGFLRCPAMDCRRVRSGLSSVGPGHHPTPTSPPAHGNPKTTVPAAGSAVRRTNPLDSPRREGESVEAKPVGDIGAGVGEDERCEEGSPPGLTRRERFGLGVALFLKCRQLDYVKNLLASPHRPNLSSDDQEALARYRRVFDTFDGEITFVTAAWDETRTGWGSDDPLMGGLSDEDLRRAVDTAGTLMKALWPT
jgi:hypothetical protein